MRQLYIIRLVYCKALCCLVGIFILNSCQKDYVDVGFDFRPDVSLTFPLLNQDIDLANFGLDTSAYQSIKAITIPLGQPNGVELPFNTFNRSMSNRVNVTSKALSNAIGVKRMSSIFTSDSLADQIQNSSLKAAFLQAISNGSTPPSIIQPVLKPNQITLGSASGLYTSSDSLTILARIENYQNVNLTASLKLKSNLDSTISATFSLPPGGNISVPMKLGASGSLPVSCSLTNFQFTPLGPLDANVPMLSLEIELSQSFTRIDADLDTVVWTMDPIQMLYLDSLSIVAPRSEIEFKPNTSFFFNHSSNLGVPLRRRLENNGQIIVDIPVTSGQTTQYPMGSKSIHGGGDTFIFQSTYYSLGCQIPANLNTRQITTTDVHAFSQPSKSVVKLQANLPLNSTMNLNTPISLPYIDSAAFFDPILSVDISSDNPLEVELLFQGNNFPSGGFSTDSLIHKLQINSSSQYSEIYIFDSSNSSLNNLVVLPIDSLTFSPRVKLMNNNDSYSISQNSFLRLSPKLTIPIQGTFGGFVFSDTVSLNLDSTLLQYSLADTIIMEFASSNPATLGIQLHLFLLDAFNQALNHQTIVILDPSPYGTNLSNGLTYVDKKSQFYIDKSSLQKSKSLAYLLEITGDSNGNLRIPSEGFIRLEANIVIP